MASLLKSLSMQWALWTGRYEAFFAVNKKDVEECIGILEEVRRNELNRAREGSVVQSSAFADHDLKYKLVGCRDKQTGKIVGCMRITKASDVAHIEVS